MRQGGFDITAVIVVSLLVAVFAAVLVHILRLLRVIHILVNSNLTAVMQAEYDGLVRELVMMEEMVDLKRAAGHEPSKLALDAIEQTKGKIEELKTTLTERQEKDKLSTA
jgi:hypothetical protein